MSQFALPRTKKKATKGKSKNIPFMDVPGSDPSAAMKGDNAQFVKGSTAPGTEKKPPQKVGPRGYVGGINQFALPKTKKSGMKGPNG
jgi:hypothetical protein